MIYSHIISPTAAPGLCLLSAVTTRAQGPASPFHHQPRGLTALASVVLGWDQVSLSLMAPSLHSFLNCCVTVKQRSSGHPISRSIVIPILSRTEKARTAETKGLLPGTFELKAAEKCFSAVAKLRSPCEELITFQCSCYAVTVQKQG